MALNKVLRWLPIKRRTATTTMAMRAKIRAYSARPWPSSRLLIDDNAPSIYPEGPAGDARDTALRPSDRLWPLA
jgi:hypothetical protein